MKEKKLYLLRDVTLGGFLTWMEKKENAILMFTRGQLAERYITEVYPERRIVVFILNRRVVKQFVAEMIASNINYAIIDLPPVPQRERRAQSAHDRSRQGAMGCEKRRRT